MSTNVSNNILNYQRKSSESIMSSLEQSLSMIPHVDSMRVFLKIQNLIEEKLDNKDHVMSSKPSLSKPLSQCHTFVVTTMAGDIAALPTLFRSYSVAGP